MLQWDRLKQLDSACLQKLDELYQAKDLPMDVREYLAYWIEEQNWDAALRDSSRAVVLFQILLENLDNQYSRFVQENNFLMHRQFRHYKQMFQRYQENPCSLAEMINWFLMKEREILEAAELAQEVQMLQVQQSSMESETQRHLEKNIRDFKSKVQVMEHSLRCLEEQQDEFDFKYQTHKMDGTPDETERNAQISMLKVMLNRLNAARKSFLSEMESLLDRGVDLRVVLMEELDAWKHRQQISCIGAAEDTSLDPLEKWYTTLGDAMFQLRKFLIKLEELQSKLSYENDPIQKLRPVLLLKVDKLLTALLQSAFVVETQPSMPQGRGPLVLRTNVQFSAKTRLLFKAPELNHAMKVGVSIDVDAPNVKGYRKFNVLGTSSKVLNMSESMNGGMVADFRHLTLKERKVGAGGKGNNDLSLSVTEELHIIRFETQFSLHDLSVSLETNSLPVVIISNSSQQQSAWASVLWFNMLCTDPKNLVFFASSPVATWPQLGQMLSWQFQSCAKRGLDADQLKTLAQKIFGNQDDYENCKISWTKFSKENCPGQNFSLWVWLDGILTLVKTYLAEMWEDGSIMGFVSKRTEKVLLKKKRGGTFLLRFSESIRDGGITFSWVEYCVKGQPSVQTVRPFTVVDLKQIPLPEILRNYQLMEAENAPVNPLQFLYPNTPKDQAFGKYYNEKTGADSPYIKYIKTKLVFVSKENRGTSATEGPAPELCVENEDPPSPLEANADVMLRRPENSPMLSDSLASPGSFPESPLSEIPEDLELIQDLFPGISPKASHGVDLFLDLPSEALSPDKCFTLQEFLNDPNLLDGVGIPLSDP